MSDLIGKSVGVYRVTEELHVGSWEIHRGQAASGARVLITRIFKMPPPGTMEALALPFEGIAKVRGTELLSQDPSMAQMALVEDEPKGYRIGDLKWPLPIDEVISVGLDLARLLTQMHAKGVVHGALRPQLVWLDQVNGRSSLTGTTPRPELFGLPTLSSGGHSPFLDDIFLPDVLAAGKPRSVSSDVAQLGMLLHRMATHTSPFVADTIMEQLELAMTGPIPPWQTGDARMQAVEELARAAFDPARAQTRSLAPLLEGLERLSR